MNVIPLPIFMNRRNLGIAGISTDGRIDCFVKASSTPAIYIIINTKEGIISPHEIFTRLTENEIDVSIFAYRISVNSDTMMYMVKKARMPVIPAGNTGFFIPSLKGESNE